MAGTPDQDAFLSQIPVRRDVLYHFEKGRVTFRIPRFTSGVGRAFGRFVRTSEYVDLTLDDIGTFIWNEIDGKKTVAAIGTSLHGEFAERVEPVYERLTVFLTQMHEKELIRYRRSRPPEND